MTQQVLSVSRASHYSHQGPLLLIIRGLWLFKMHKIKMLKLRRQSAWTNVGIWKEMSGLLTLLLQGSHRRWCAYPGAEQHTHYSPRKDLKARSTQEEDCAWLMTTFCPSLPHLSSLSHLLGNRVKPKVNIICQKSIRIGALLAPSSQDFSVVPSLWLE